MKFFQDETGSTPVEYATIASLIAVAIIGALVAMSDSTEALYDKIASGFASALEQTPQ